MIASASGSIVQSNHYYPFGMSSAEGSATSQQPYKYNGKELDTERGLNLYDYSARYMDPALGRFNTVNSLAEKYYSISPYVYVGNNPPKFIDPDGKKIIIGTSWQRFMGKLGLDSYVAKVTKHFMQNNMDSRRIESTFNQLEKSDLVFRILPLSEFPIKNAEEKGNHVIPDFKIKKREQKQGATMYYDPDMQETPSGDVRTPRVGLAHETGHLEDYMNGNVIPVDREKADAGNKVEIYKIELNKQNAMEVENIIRGILNYENRREYFK